MVSNSKTSLAEQKRKYRIFVQNLPLRERLRQLEELQEQSYEILHVREANGGKPVPAAWKRWAAAQVAADIEL